jgi:hypothetical protein
VTTADITQNSENSPNTAKVGNNSLNFQTFPNSQTTAQTFPNSQTTPANSEIISTTPTSPQQATLQPNESATATLKTPFDFPKFSQPFQNQAQPQSQKDVYSPNNFQNSFESPTNATNTALRDFEFLKAQSPAETLKRNFKIVDDVVRSEVITKTISNQQTRNFEQNLVNFGGGLSNLNGLNGLNNVAQPQQTPQQNPQNEPQQQQQNQQQHQGNQNQNGNNHQNQQDPKQPKFAFDFAKNTTDEPIANFSEFYSSLRDLQNLKTANA